jgi:hypothetical protein
MVGRIMYTDSTGIVRICAGYINSKECESVTKDSKIYIVDKKIYKKIELKYFILFIPKKKND